MYARRTELLGLALLCLLPSVARATMIQPLALDELVDRSEHVALAVVESQQARWTSNRSAIYTEVVARVTRSMKGGVPVGETLTFRREGGVVGATGMRVEGAAVFSPGEEVLLFLEPRGEAWWTVGMAQGKMHVTDVAGQRVVVRQGASSGLSFTTRPDGTPPPVEPAVAPLEDVLGRIAARVAQPRTLLTPGAR